MTLYNFYDKYDLHKRINRKEEGDAWKKIIA